MGTLCLFPTESLSKISIMGPSASFTANIMAYSSNVPVSPPRYPVFAARDPLYYIKFCFFSSSSEAVLMQYYPIFPLFPTNSSPMPYIRPEVTLIRPHRRLFRTRKRMDPDCAICSKPAAEQCECEARGLDLAVRQAEQRMMASVFSDIRYILTFSI
jgi:hypothetical protein